MTQITETYYVINVPSSVNKKINSLFQKTSNTLPTLTHWITGEPTHLLLALEFVGIRESE